ncbi:hypothetical protein HDU97_000079 [Phlyctochytrium planicorne]|nr:hypothetical protein HDU97_000079 [Phlyctochytrium planicorne]
MVGVGGITAENAENHPDIERQWAVKALHHAETYFKLLTAVGPSKMRLTKMDDEIYTEFRTEFPDLNVEKLNELEDFKTDTSKEKWRNWVMKYEKTVTDYNFGTLIRVNAKEDYSAENSFFATTDISDAILNVLNESSVGLYRVQEHVFKKVPQLVTEQKELEAVATQVELASSDLAEAQELVAKMGRIKGFSASDEWVEKMEFLRTLVVKRSFSTAVGASKEHLIAQHGTYPKGFLAGATSVGIKKGTGKLDMTLVRSSKPCTAAGVFTKNAFAAAPVQVCKDILKTLEGKGLTGVIVNSGCANACTGEQGLKDAWETAKGVDSAFGISGLPSLSTLVMSTGVIGQNLDMAKINKGIKTFGEGKLLSEEHDGWHASAKGIMTTDTFPKLRSHQYKSGGVTTSMAGWSKGAGMIHPNMATMLSAVFTDANVSSKCLESAVRYAADRSFNAISVDGDTSTNDTFLVLANGASGGKLIDNESSTEYALFRDNLVSLSTELAKLIVRDGEGATKFVEVRVKGSSSFEEGKQVASTVATSPLVKTAIFGRDANWGRIICAVGYSGVPVDTNEVDLFLKSADETSALRLFHKGGPDNIDESKAAKILENEDILIEIDLKRGENVVSMYTCDFSHGYISINADYRS